MKNFSKIWSAIKGLSIAEMIVIGTIFVTTIGWVFKANAQMERGCERDKKILAIEEQIQDIKISVAELKISTCKIDKNVELLLERGLYARDNR